jgi:hypothetical protein
MTHVSQEMADSTLENAHSAVDLAFDAALTTLRHPSAPKLVRWAASMGHASPTLEMLRAASRSEGAP